MAIEQILEGSAGEIRARLNNNFEYLDVELSKKAENVHAHAEYATKASVDSALNEKVDVVPGKGLSSIDFDNNLNAKLTAADDHVGTAHAPSTALPGAETQRIVAPNTPASTSIIGAIRYTNTGTEWKMEVCVPLNADESAVEWRAIHTVTF